jgi:hypothetical protein
MARWDAQRQDQAVVVRCGADHGATMAWSGVSMRMKTIRP